MPRKTNFNPTKGSPMADKPQYRLVRRGELIERGDQPLGDDCETWLELSGWEIGMDYRPGTLVPLRRRLVRDNESELVAEAKRRRDRMDELERQPTNKLDRLTNAIVENILATSDEDILAEAREDGGLCPVCDNQAYTPGTRCKCCGCGVSV